MEHDADDEDMPSFLARVNNDPELDDVDNDDTTFTPNISSISKQQFVANSHHSHHSPSYLLQIPTLHRKNWTPHCNIT